MVRFYKYIKIREEEDREESKLVETLQSRDKSKIKKAMEKQDKKEQAKKGRYDSGNVKKKAKKANSHISQIVLFLAQLFMFLMAYAYHSSFGLFNLCWVILSFILPTN